ncbi:MAG: class I SAM-dependent RNA methyltransferase [Treponema sp.]|jgi:putative N6-adenine-specific DNA methylase|nr:class I SAM-dependent RNA methyltransferase [Treponema sp.]
MPKIDTAVALCAVGAEKIVSNEIRKLGLQVSEAGFGRVRFRTDLNGLYRALMGLRAADRVLLETAWFEAADFDALFEGVRNVPWEEYIPQHFGVRVAKVRSNRSALKAETSIQAVVHKAAAERLCTKRKVNRLPENGDEAEIRIYIEKDRVSVLLDLSGEPLFKRMYRTKGGIAPLRETTAAAIILHSGWRRKFPLYDPFCGAGTIAIEAAMYAWDIAPGLGRHFALEQLLLGDRETGRKVREEFLSKVDFSRLVRIGGSDSDAAAVAAARANLDRAVALGGGAAPPSLPSFRVLPMEEAKPSGCFEAADAAGFIITNPPYGRRLGDAESAEETYAEMGKLARHFSGWKLALISDHSGFESFFGKKADSCREITNGAVRSYLFQYEKL